MAYIIIYFNYNFNIAVCRDKTEKLFCGIHRNMAAPNIILNQASQQN